MSAESSTTSTSERSSEDFVTVREIVKKDNSVEKSTGDSGSSDEMKSSALLSSLGSSDSFARLDWCGPGSEPMKKSADSSDGLLKESLLFRKQRENLASSPIKRVASEIHSAKGHGRQIEYLSDYEYFNPSSRNLRSNSEPPNGQPINLNLRKEQHHQGRTPAVNSPFLPSTNNPTTLLSKLDEKPQSIKQVYYV